MENASRVCVVCVGCESQKCKWFPLSSHAAAAKKNIEKFISNNTINILKWNIFINFTIQNYCVTIFQCKVILVDYCDIKRYSNK